MSTGELHVGITFDASGFTIDFDRAYASIRRARVITMCMACGAPDDVGPATAWHEVGSDECRVALLDEVQDFRGFELTDDERENIRTVSDVIALAEARAS